MFNNFQPQTTQAPTTVKCTGTGKFCVPEATCINGTIDTSAGGLIEAFFKPEASVEGAERCNATHVCCQEEEVSIQFTFYSIYYFTQIITFKFFICYLSTTIIFQPQTTQAPTADNCTATGRFCVPEETCINGTIDTTAGGLIEAYFKREESDQIADRCNATHVCCQAEKEVNIYLIFSSVNHFYKQLLPFRSPLFLSTLEWTVLGLRNTVCLKKPV